VAMMTDRDVDLSMDDPTIIRNRAKIEATLHNARLLTAMSLNDIAWQYRPRQRHPLRQWSDGRAQSPESRQLATELRRKGFRLVGPVVAHSFMQTVGVENRHFDGCFLAHQPIEHAHRLLSTAASVSLLSSDNKDGRRTVSTTRETAKQDRDRASVRLLTTADGLL
jgi:Methyladenine glycosylase